LLFILARSNWFFVLLILITNFVAVVFYFLAWHVMLRNLTNISLYESFKATSISIFFNIIIPSFSIGGEYARINYLNKHNKVSNEVALATLSINKFQYGLTMILFFILGTVVMYFYNIESFSLIPSIIIVSFLTFFLLILILKPNLIKIIAYSILKIIRRFSRFDESEFEKIKNKSDFFIEEFSYYARYLLKSHSSLIALSLMIIQWLFNSLSFYIAFLAIGHLVNLGILIFTFPIIAALTVSSFLIPANIGIVEPIMIGIYTGFQIDPVISAAAIILARSVIILEDLLICFPFALKWGLRTKLF